MTYFNTTLESGDRLVTYRNTAHTQQERIQAFFETASEFLYTPSQVLEYVFMGENVPLTSVRRAISDLTEAGVLFKTGRKRVGAYGRPEYCWRRRVPSKRQPDLFE